MKLAVTYMCMHGKKRPDTGKYIKKPTLVKGTKEACEAIAVQCDHPHDHDTVMGRIRIPSADGGWKSSGSHLGRSLHFIALCENLKWSE